MFNEKIALGVTARGNFVHLKIKKMVELVEPFFISDNWCTSIRRKMENCQQNSKHDFGNWVKCCTALRYLRSGLQSFVSDEVEQIHKSTLRSLKIELIHCMPCTSNSSRQCSHDTKLECDTCKLKHCADKIKQHHGDCIWAQCLHCRDQFCTECKVSSHELKKCECTIATLKQFHHKQSYKQSYRSKCNFNGKGAAKAQACRNNVCHHFYDSAISKHEKHDPMFVNCDPTLWREDPWEFAKCFLSSPGFAGRKCPKDLDAAALLSICINEKAIHTSIKNIQLFIDVSTMLRTFYTIQLFVEDCGVNVKTGFDLYVFVTASMVFST